MDAPCLVVASRSAFGDGDLIEDRDEECDEFVFEAGYSLPELTSFSRHSRALYVQADKQGGVDGCDKGVEREAGQDGDGGVSANSEKLV